ncbi:hypothetical protein BEI60_04805 [Eisenbergiella tayi]|nr:hypothetical protein BEI60_04805 [Eisenbergiella tayi]
MVIKDDPDGILGWIFFIEELYKINKILIFVHLAHQQYCFSSKQINTYQQGKCPKAFGFSIPVYFSKPHGWTQVRSGI